MSSSSVSSGPSGIPGDPLLAAAANAGKFLITLDAERYFYPAASHRRPIKSLEISNLTWVGDEEIIVTIFTEALGANSFIHPVAKAYPPIKPGESISVDVLGLRPDFNELAHLDESLFANIVVRISISGEMITEERRPLQVLAYNQWMHDKNDFECLSAFVFPNHPVVARIMEGVRARLQRDTTNGATSGYQPFASGIEVGLSRNREVMRAIFEELQSLELEYSDPPQSFEGYGQKIRTPEVILRERVATCLDSSVLAASCIGAAGLSPLIFIVQGHAFPAVWSTPGNSIDEFGKIKGNSLSPAVISNVNDFQALTDLGMIFSFESTQICKSIAKPFEVAEERHRDYASGLEANDFKAIIDVARSREIGVRGLPNRVPIAGTNEYDIEIDRSSFDIVPSEVVEDTDSYDEGGEFGALSDGDVPRRVRRWMDALLDVSNTNPLINLLTREVFLPLKGTRAGKGINLNLTPGLLSNLENRLMSGSPIRALCAHKMPTHLLQNPNNQNVLEEFQRSGCFSMTSIATAMEAIAAFQERLEAEGQSPVNALHIAQQTFEKNHESEATRRFRALKKLADDIEADSATNQLFLTIGTLAWISPGEEGRASKEVRSPLFVIPVRLSGNASSGFNISLDSGGEITPNYCLVEKLRIELGLRIPELESPDLDESGIDVTKTIATIRKQLIESKQSTIRVDEEAQLAVLDFATFRMWKDVKSNWKLFTKNRVVDHLINGSNATLVQSTVPFLGEPLTPFSCDESQMEAVQWALEGKSFVLEGPPGTGKSQTIANLIAACVAEGKRVLFVAEKQVALEAVSSKLEEIGLDPFCITMHHESTTPESIRKQLQVSLDFEGEDVSHQWQSDSLVVQSLQDRLVKYRDSIVEPNALRFNSLTAHQEVLRRGEGESLMVDPIHFPTIGQHLVGIESALLNIQSVVGSSRVVVDPNWALATVSDMGTFDGELLARVCKQIDGVLLQNNHLRPLLETLLESVVSIGVPSAISDAAQLITDGNSLSAEACSAVLEPSWMSDIEALLTDIQNMVISHSDVFTFFELAALQIDLTPQMTAASEAISAGFLSRGRKTEQLRSLLRHIVKGSLEKQPAEIMTLLQKVAPVRATFEHISQSLRGIPYLSIRADFDPLEQSHVNEVRVASQETLTRARVLSAPEATIVRKMESNGVILQRSDISLVELVLNSWAHIKVLMACTSDSISKWRADRSLLEALLESLPVWVSASPSYTYLSNLALINQTLEPLRLGGLIELEQSIIAGNESLDDVHVRFMRGLAVSARDERLNSGSLSVFQRNSFDVAIAEFTRKEASRRDLMRKVIPRQLSESRPFSPQMRTGVIGNLERELSKKVKRVPISQLIRSYGEVITQLTPCFLMSPEAVSRLLPAESQFFDIAVFDEASQIRVAAAIPAMGRAKATIVVGDSQQMPPSRKAGQRQISSENELILDDDEVSQDLESILSECSESNIPSLMLKCHFRSQHEGLIAFSNRNFYENNLVTFPAPNTDQTTPVSWFDVPNGQFIRSGEGKGTNPEEAKAIVAEIIRRLEDPEHASKSIGVVTFNELQAGHIYELLEAEVASHPALSDAMNNPKKKDRLFVTALERVQGDERDTIILSVSYSYQDAKRNSVSPQWGPLTHKGGERRLNVAITRAKQDLLVFCSFDPNHVSSHGSKHLGVPYTVEFLKECRDAARTNGVALKARDVTTLDYHRRKMFDLLRSRGIMVRENVGLSRFRIDLAVTDQEYGSQFLAILLDGDEWSKRGSPFDREVLPNSVLHLVGWRRLGRIWLKSAIEEPELVLSLVQNEIEREQLRVELQRTLEEAGFEVRSDGRLSNIGVDLAVRKPGQRLWPLAVVLNGPNLFRQFHAYEGDVPPDGVLRDVQCIEGYSVWLPDLKANRGACMEKISLAFDRAEQLMPMLVAEDVSSDFSPLTVTEMLKEKERAAEVGPILLASPMHTEFVDSRSLPVLGGQAVLGPGAGMNIPLIRRAADEIVEAEGPITEKRLMQVLVARFKMSKVTTARSESLRRHFTSLTQTSTPFGVVYWSSTRQPDIWKGFRTSSAAESRAIDEVPAEEIVNAMVAVVAMGSSCFREEVIRNVAEAFGRKAVTKVLDTNLGAILDWSVSQGRLVLDTNLYKLP